MNPAALAKVAMAVRPNRKATASEQMKSTLMKAGGQVALGVVKTGGGIVKGMAGLTSMAAKSKLREADDFEAGRTPRPKNFVPIHERHQTDPWYKRIPKQINDALNLSPKDPKVIQQAKHNLGSWASAAKPMLNSVAKRADKEYDAADKSLKKIEPDLGTAGKTAAFASSLIPGARALDIPMAIGAAKNVSGGVVPAVAAFATRKIPVPLVRNATQEAISTAATPQATLPKKPLPEKNA
jgi:hypothetical protein